jgi:hypothetical protein
VNREPRTATVIDVEPDAEGVYADRIDRATTGIGAVLDVVQNAAELVGQVRNGGKLIRARIAEIKRTANPAPRRRRRRNPSADVLDAEEC